MTNYGLAPISIEKKYRDEVHLRFAKEDFVSVCSALHRVLKSPVRMMFAREQQQNYAVSAVFLDDQLHRWVFAEIEITKTDPQYPALSQEMFSASLFEREIEEMFGIRPQGSPDQRRLRLHDEVWPDKAFPLRKDFSLPANSALGQYDFTRVAGEGVFEIPVGPVHAGIIGPGHFRFSVAGEPIILLEERLGFAHRGVEKLMEGRTLEQGLSLAERVAGEAAFSHSLALAMAAEKIAGLALSENTRAWRAVLLELERIYNHINGLGGIALDVGASWPADLAACLKEACLNMNRQLTGSRFLKGINCLGGFTRQLTGEQRQLINRLLPPIMVDLGRLQEVLNGNEIFLDRIETTGVLKETTARDLGVSGLTARASGIPFDLRQSFPILYERLGFRPLTKKSGDVWSRYKLRLAEIEQSVDLINKLLELCTDVAPAPKVVLQAGEALGYIEGWRGATLYWLSIDAAGLIDRCKIVDPSFHNWPALAYAVLGEIIPDFPVCNKSFDLSYPGND